MHNRVHLLLRRVLVLLSLCAGVTLLLPALLFESFTLVGVVAIIFAVQHAPVLGPIVTTATFLVVVVRFLVLASGWLGGRLGWLL